jgi:hypothetical protein
LTAELGERTKLRAELGYGDDERVCIVTVGGSGVGASLLRRVIAAFPQAKGRVPELRMIVVAGPRIDPESLPSHAGPVAAWPSMTPRRSVWRRGSCRRLAATSTTAMWRSTRRQGGPAPRRAAAGLARPLARLVAPRIELIHARHALWRQDCADDPEQRDEEPEDEQDQMLVLEGPYAEEDEQEDVKDAQSDV